MDLIGKITCFAINSSYEYVNEVVQSRLQIALSMHSTIKGRQERGSWMNLRCNSVDVSKKIIRALSIMASL